MHANWVQKSLENATCHPFGTKSRPGGFQDAQPRFGVPQPLGAFFIKICASRAQKGFSWDLKWFPKRAFEARLARGPSKNEFLGVVFESIRHLMNFQCGNA